MTIKVGINGFGRIGRLVLRAAWTWPEIEFIQINDLNGDASTLAHLLNFDSVHGRWSHEAESNGANLVIDGHVIQCSQNEHIHDTDWSGCDVVVEASGVMRKPDLLEEYLQQNVKRVVVTAPVKAEGILNIVMGINDNLYNPDQHRIVTAASCTTNCLAPVVKVIHEQLGIEHGVITTIHDLTNTQSIMDTPLKDLRRARSSSMNLIPTTTGSATAITEIFPELKGKLNGHAVRVPLANASLTDCVFEVKTKTSSGRVNSFLKLASETDLNGIMGYEERPLVSTDYRGDPRSCVIDALSTMVVDETQVKIYAWYDNEWGYSMRTAELVKLVGA